LGVIPPKRDAQIVNAKEIRGLDLPLETQVLIPPAVRHEIGADALAMMIQTGMLEKEEIAIVTDYGTNAEMALIAKGSVYTGSTAAGPALEGQQIEDGLWAVPGAICDVGFEPLEGVTPDIAETLAENQPTGGEFRTHVLDDAMTAGRGGYCRCRNRRGNRQKRCSSGRDHGHGRCVSNQSGFNVRPHPEYISGETLFNLEDPQKILVINLWQSA
jgi:uncharacterized 2Fe-2S/4Fe-4S cluster protein (DUF4445 family)